MTLQNLLGVSLDTVTPERSQVARMLAAAERNLADYSGDLVPDSSVNECITSATALQTHVRAWLQSNKPDLV